MLIPDRILGIAPEFNGVVQWINSEPLRVKDLRGKVFLVDFWTYSCVNCIRTLPGLRKLYNKYKDYGFLIIGVHTPEFEFEKDTNNIKTALKRYKIEYPVAVDSNFAVWRSYFNQFWPAHYLINKDGKIKYTHFGEGGEKELEEKIRELLKEAGHKLPEGKAAETKSISYGTITHETYLGQKRGILGSSVACTKEGCDVFIGQTNHEEGIPYPKGQWLQESEYLEFTDKNEGYLLLKFRAREVNLVMGNLNEQIEVEVLLNKKPLKKSEIGKDIFIKNNKSLVKVDHHDIYNLFKIGNIVEAEISIAVNKKGLRCYAYTFG